MKLFGNRIEPSCCICKFGKKSKDGQMILCNKCGVVAPYYSCRRYKYAPLKRVPHRYPALPKYENEEFML